MGDGIVTTSQISTSGSAGPAERAIALRRPMSRSRCRNGTVPSQSPVYRGGMEAVDLAVYADALAGEAATLAARAERARARIRQAAIERAARAALDRDTAMRLERLGLLGRTDDAAAREELRDLEAALDALERLQAWVERRLADAAA